MLEFVNTTEISTKKLRKRLFFFFSSALLILAISLTSSIFITLFDKLKKAENSSLTNLAELRSVAVSEWSRRARDIANQITSRTRIREELEKYNSRLIKLEKLVEFTRPKLHDAKNLSSEIVGIIRLDKNHQIITGCGCSSETDFSQSDVSEYIFNDTVVSEPVIIDNRLLIIVSAPILNRNNERQGTDLVFIDPVNLRKIISDTENPDQTREIIAGYSNKNEILPLFPLHPQNDRYSEKNDFSLVKDFMRLALENKSGLGRVSDLVVAYHSIEDSDWGLLITMNQSELYSPVYKSLFLIGVLSFVIYLIILSAFWFLLKPLAGKILMHSSDLERKIQEKTQTLEKEIVVRKQVEVEKEKIIAELRDAILKIKTLSGMLPICSNCKKIRDDKGYWNQIELYIRKHSDAEFSHGLCPECARLLYPGIDIYDENDEL